MCARADTANNVHQGYKWRAGVDEERHKSARETRAGGVCFNRCTTLLSIVKAKVKLEVVHTQQQA